MTQRLFYADPYGVHFEARVTERLTLEGQPAVVLDRTLFYPAAGGQPSDRGALAGVPVTDVIEREGDKGILHVLAHPLPEGVVEVEGEIDWERRFDHMQQHTGQHVLSAAFERVLGAETIGFHLGSDVVTIDVDVAGLGWDQVAPVVKSANEVVWNDHPVRVDTLESSEAETLSVRRPTSIEGPIRIVTIGDKVRDGAFDVNPCGGTHVSRTGEIGLIKITRLDHRGDETRVEFLCGKRAFDDYQTKDTILNQLSSRLTVGYWELDAAVERLEEQAKGLYKDLQDAQDRLVTLEAERLAQEATSVGPVRIVWRVLEGREPQQLRALAQTLARDLGVVAWLFSLNERTQICFARPDGVDLDMNAFLQEACAQLDGKGGGRPSVAQGSAPSAPRERIQIVVSDLLSSIQSD